MSNPVTTLPLSGHGGLGRSGPLFANGIFGFAILANDVPSRLPDAPRVPRGHGGWRPNSGRPKGGGGKPSEQLRTLRNEALTLRQRFKKLPLDHLLEVLNDPPARPSNSPLVKSARGGRTLPRLSAGKHARSCVPPAFYEKREMVCTNRSARTHYRCGHRILRFLVIAQL